MFDGEEVNEVEENNDNTVEEGTTCLADVPSQDEENKETDEIELDVLNVAKLGDTEHSKITDHCIEETNCDKKDSALSLQQNSKSTIIDIANGEMVEDGKNGSSKQLTDDNEKVSILYLSFLTFQHMHCLIIILMPTTFHLGS